LSKDVAVLFPLTTFNSCSAVIADFSSAIGIYGVVANEENKGELRMDDPRA